MSKSKKEITTSTPKEIHGNGLEAGSLITQSLKNLDRDQASRLLEEASKEALRLESKQIEQNLDYVVGKKTIEDHVDTFDMLDKKNVLTRHKVVSDVKTGAGNMRIESKSGATCFVASAVYEDPNHPDVIVLRKYRDDILAKNFLGRVFIKIYWVLGPRLAVMVGGHPRTKALCRRALRKLTLFLKDNFFAGGNP